MFVRLCQQTGMVGRQVSVTEKGSARTKTFLATPRNDNFKFPAGLLCVQHTKVSSRSHGEVILPRYDLFIAIIH